MNEYVPNKMWCVARFGSIKYTLTNVKNTHGGVLILVKLQAFTTYDRLFPGNRSHGQQMDEELYETEVQRMVRNIVKK